MIPRPENPLIAALDVPTLARAEELAAVLAPHVAILKVGLELFCAEGPAAVRRVAAHAPVFLDLKLHDIPNTVEGAARRCGTLGVRMLTVHALGGEAMVAAAARGIRAGAEEVGAPPPLLVAVTVLSSLAGEGLASPASLAYEARAAGADAIVVSGGDVAVVREALGDDVVLVVPGVRPAGSNGDDQVRVLTPPEAIEAGADYLVVGRPITAATDPASAARGILASVR
ncbi:MAG: orotidine-5'-phosphate decarboxylase [Actinomycetota bacterium]